MGSKVPGATHGPHFEVSTGDIIKQLEGLNHDDDFASIYEGEEAPAGTALEHAKALAIEFELNGAPASGTGSKADDLKTSTTNIKVVFSGAAGRDEDSSEREKDSDDDVDASNQVAGQRVR